MSVMHALKRLRGGESGGDLDEREACDAMGAMLDGGVSDLELGAILALLEDKPVALPELLGYSTALSPRCSRLRTPVGMARPVVFACYHGVRDHPHLLPLVALTLQRLRVPVLVHGVFESGHGTAAAHIFRNLGVLPSASLALAQMLLDDGEIAFVPTAALAPGLATLMALRGRLGFDGLARSLARLLTPFGHDALHVVTPDAVLGRKLLREFLAESGCPALLLEGAEGEAFADTRRRPLIEYVGAESVALRQSATLPAASDAHGTAAWIRRAVSGEIPLPLSLVNQLACCLYGAGRADDMNQAKAIVAVATGSLAAA